MQENKNVSISVLFLAVSLLVSLPASAAEAEVSVESKVADTVQTTNAQPGKLSQFAEAVKATPGKAFNVVTSGVSKTVNFSKDTAKVVTQYDQPWFKLSETNTWKDLAEAWGKRSVTVVAGVIIAYQMFSSKSLIFINEDDIDDEEGL